MTGSRTVVTGGAGFIGSHLVDQLVRNGSDVVVVDDLSTGSKENLSQVASRVTLIVDDLRGEACAEVVADAEAVYHLAVRNVRASINQPADNFAVNADGTLAVLEAMRLGRRGRFLYVSSSEVYGIPDDATYRETTVPAPTTAYGAGKLAGEHIALAYHRTYGLDTRVVRPFNNYGPRSHFEGDSGEVIPKFILRAMAGKPLVVHGDGSQSRDFMYVEDTAVWLRRLLGEDRLIGDTVNIGTGIDTTVLELAHAIVGLTGSPSVIEHADPRPGDLPRLCADTAKIRSIVDFSLTTELEEGLRRTIDYFRQFDPEALLQYEVERNW